MAKEEPKIHLGCPETRVLRINLAVDEAVGRMFSYRLPRKKRKETGSKSIDPVKVRDQNQASKEGILADSRTGT